MSNEKDLEQLKKKAAIKAKAAAAAKLAAKKEEATTPPVDSTPPENETEEEKKKRLKQEAVAKAKAAAQAKLAAKKEEATTPPADSTPPENETEEEKKKRIKQEAIAKAKAAAAAKLASQEAASTSSVDSNPPENETEEEKKKRIKQEAIAKAKAAAQAKVKGAPNDASTTPTPKQTSKNDLFLEKYIQVIEEHVGKDAIKEAYINFLSKEVPTMIIDSSMYFRITQFLRFNEQLAFDMLVELHASDLENSIELYLYLYSTINKQHLVLKTLLKRDQPSIESVSSLWAGANWPECEAYDLLGVHFTGHPYLHRILLGEDWKGYPLRKDYKAYDDVEV